MDVVEKKNPKKTDTNTRTYFVLNIYSVADILMFTKFLFEDLPRIKNASDCTKKYISKNPA